MTYSFVQYSANGATTQFAIPCPYINRSHVKVYIDGTEDASKTFVSSTIIQTSTTPANGAVVEVRRVTPKTTPVVDFSDSSVLTASNLDAIATQFLYLAQEAADDVASSLGLVSDGTYDALTHRIKNVGTPTQSTDAATKGYVDTADAVAVAAAEGFRDEAEGFATDASGSVADCEAQVLLANGYASTASGHVTTAAGHVTTAAGHVTAAEAARDAAEAFRDEAEGFTEGFATIAQLRDARMLSFLLAS